jgi:hypothetical protein
VQVAIERRLAADRRGSLKVTTAASSWPCDASCSQVPKLFPKCWSNSAGSAAATSPIVWMPSVASFSLAFGPMPFTFFAGSGQIRAGMSPGSSKVRPSGLSRSEQIFDSNLVRCDADRTGQSGRRMHPVLQSARYRATAVVLGARNVGEVDVDLVDAAVLDARCDASHRRLEESRVLAIFVEVDRQQDRRRGQLRRLHHAHARVDAERTRLVRARRDHAAPGVVAEHRELARPVGADRRLMPAAAADHDGLPFQFRIPKQLDRRIERVHVQMGNEAAGYRWHGLRPARAGNMYSIAARRSEATPATRSGSRRSLISLACSVTLEPDFWIAPRILHSGLGYS